MLTNYTNYGLNAEGSSNGLIKNTYLSDRLIMANLYLGSFNKPRCLILKKRHIITGKTKLLSYYIYIFILPHNNGNNI